MVRLWNPIGLPQERAMRMLRIFAFAVALLSLPVAARAGEFGLRKPSQWSPADLPQDARSIVEEYQKAAKSIQDRADAEIDAQREKTLPRLKALQDEYCRAMKLEEAIAIRQAIRHLSGLDRDQAILRRMTPDDVGKSMLLEVTGSVQGTVWGSGVYTSDSSLGAAAVHDGVLKVGERGVLRVRVVEGQESYLGTAHNGVTSLSYGPWPVSFTIERVAPTPAGADKDRAR
jgi:hypothetical protein